MNSVAISLGNFDITWYSLCILVGVMLASLLFLLECKKYEINIDFGINLIFWTVIFGIIGARIYFVLFNLSYYLENPIEILEVWKGGLAIHGGIIGGLLFIIFYSLKYKVRILKMTDMAVVGLIIAQAMGRWGNFFNGEAHGPEIAREALENMHLPNFIIEGMHIDGKYYHPTFLYESIWNFLGFILLIILRKKLKLKTGVLTGIYFMWYSLCRFFIESLRTDSLMLGPLKVAQIVSILLFLLGLFLVLRTKKDTRINRLKERTK